MAQSLAGISDRLQELQPGEAKYDYIIAQIRVNINGELKENDEAKVKFCF